MRRMRILTVLALSSILAASTLALADEAVSAREHYRRGTNAFNLGHYIEAIKEYEAAYQLKDDPALLFNIAQAYRLAGENDAAVRVYKSYLHQVPESPQRPEVERRIAELQALIEQQRKAREAPPEGTLAPRPSMPNEPTPPPSTLLAAPPPQAEARAPWYKDTAAMTLAGIGVAALGAGIGLAVKGNLDLSHAETAPDLQDHDNLRSSGTTFSIAGYVSLGVGAALCTAAAGKWAFRPKRQRLTAGVGISGSGAAITFGGSY
jgi:tetratricopeptide (TPR) repeat protein